MTVTSTPVVTRLALRARLRPEAVFALLFADHAYSFWLRRGAREVMGCADAGPGGVVQDPLAHPPGGDGALRVRGSGGRGDAGDDRPVPGWFGWVSYEDGIGLLGLEPRPRERASASVMMRCSRIVVVESASREIELAWSNDDAGGSEWARETASRIGKHAAALAGSRGAAAGTAEAETPRATAPSSREPRWRHSDDRYLELIRRCLDTIRRGDAYQLCLTNQATIETTVDPLRLHAALRALSPAPESAVIRCGDTALVSSSPERFLTLGRNRVISTHPIKGTRRRGNDAHADLTLAHELRRDPKERAENVMIVDLMRNDLSRVCELGTVAVTRLFEVESYPQVHQLVSTVEGRLRAGLTIWDALVTCFPAGSMTGAPKQAAVTILRELEDGPRGIYSGCYGSIGFDGTAHLSMAIRTAIVGPGTVTIGAGGGITSASSPERELAEVKLKASALIEAVRRASVE